MAHDQQVLQWGSGTGQFTEPVALDRGGAGIGPAGIIFFRGAATLDGSGAGDTAETRIVFPLPGGNVHQLYSFGFHIEQSSVDFTQGVLELYTCFLPSTATDSTQINWPVIMERGGRNLSQSQLQYSGTLGFGSLGSGTDRSAEPPHGASAFRQWLPGTDIGGANPVLDLGAGGTTAVPSATIRLALGFLTYTVDQWRDARLYAGLANR